MKKILHKSYAWLVMLVAMFAMSTGAMAQDPDATFDLRGLSVNTLTSNEVTITFKNYTQGANIYNNWLSYSLKIESEKNIIRIEFEGSDATYEATPVIEKDSQGSFNFEAYGTSVWTGSSKSVHFIGVSGTDFYVSDLRVWLESSGGSGGSGGGSGSDNVPVDPSAPVYNAVKVQNAEVGKIYTLTMFNSSQQEYPITIQSNAIKATASGTHAMFKCGDNGDGIFFSTADGKYLRYPQTTNTWLNNYSTTGLSTEYNADFVPLTFESVPSTGTNITSSSAYSNGCVAIYQARGYRNDNSNLEMGYITYTSNGGASAAGGIYYNNDYTSAFILREVQAFPTTVLGQEGEDYYGTYYANHAWEIPTGYKAYVVTNVDGDQMTLEEVSGTVVGANTAVILMGERSESLPIQFSLESGYTNNDNMLRGAVEDFNGVQEEGYKYYVLTYDTTGANLGFYWQSGSGDGSTLDCAAHKAYLRVPASSASNGFRFRFDDVTAIETIATESNDVIFNLQGQRVNAAKAGVYVKNGKKYIVK